MEILNSVFGSSSLIYPLWATTMVVLSLILIPRDDYQKFFLYGILGATITGAFLATTINAIKAWKYIDIFPFSFWGISIFVLVAWGASIILFLWGLPEKFPTWIHYVYIGIFALIGTIIGNTFHNLGLRPHSQWYKSWMWFPVLYLNFWINYKIWMARQKYD